MLGISFNAHLFICHILSGITGFIWDNLITTLKAEAGSPLWDKSTAVIGNEETNSFNCSINQNVIFLVQVPWRKLSG